MLVLENINVQFGDKVIFEHACYRAYKGKINLIEGKSGSGKSTLIQTLLFKHACNYIFNGTDLSSLNEKEQSDYIFRAISVVYQEPLFLNDLTVRQNASFLKKLYGTDDDMKNIRDYLDINALLDKYPGQLSGGEKTRISVWLALLKTPEILILDEPTASLDRVNKTKVIKVLQEYAKHAIVICSTHDTSFLKIECHKATVENARILQQQVDEKAVSAISKETNKNLPDQLYVYMKSFFHHPLMNIGKILFLSLSTAFMFVSFNFNNVAVEAINESLNDLSSREMIIYKPLFADFHYVHDSETFPFSDDELKSLLSIDGIESLTPRIDLYVDGNRLYSSYDSIFNSDYKNELGERYLEDTSRTKIEILDETGAVLRTAYEPYAVEVYSDDRDYSDVIVNNYQKDGIFISERLAGKLGLQSMDKKFLTFTLPVPLYNCIGNVYIPDPNSADLISKFYPRNSTVCLPIQITMPIRATIRNKYGDIMIPVNVFYKQINANKPDLQEATVYFIRENNEYYINELPEEYAGVKFEESLTGNLRMELTLWKPVAYTATCADLGNMHDVIERIEDAGFKADNDYYDTQAVIAVQESTRFTMIVISVFISIIVFGTYFIIQYIRRSDIVRLNEYMFINGIDKKSRIIFFVKDMGLWTVFSIGLTSFFYMCATNLLARIGVAVIRPELKAFVGVSITILIAEFGFPCLLRRGILNDKLQKY